MNEKDLVRKFFLEGYENKNYDFIMECVSENYFDHSPAGARSNQDAVNILQAVAEMFGKLTIGIEDVFAENGMVAVRVSFQEKHIGNCMGIEPTGKTISFEALENFKVENGKIVESWGYWPDLQIQQLLKEARSICLTNEFRMLHTG